MTDRIDRPRVFLDNHAMADTTTAQSTKLGGEFARALQHKDAARLVELLAPEIDFRALTPKRTWEAEDPEGVISIVFGHWFEDSDEIRTLERLETDEFADRQQVVYRFAIENPEGRFLVEQQAYLEPTSDGRIGWMRVVCSGYRPVAG